MSDEPNAEPESERDPTDATNVPGPGPLVPQPHGGALRKGGQLGNKGGGRKPEWFRAAARDLLEQYNLLPRLAAIGAGLIGEIKIVKDEDGNPVEVYCETPIKEQNKAIEILTKLGIGFQQATTGPNGEPLAVFVAAVTDASGRRLGAGEVSRLEAGTAGGDQDAG